MPVIRRTNTRVPPANNRAVDVAKRAIEDITPVFQRRYLNAFMVQGYPGILYNRLKSGIRCSCQSSGKVLNSLLDEKGNADAGTINQFLTGANFGTSSYGASTDLNEQTSKDNPLQKFQGTFDISATEEYPNEIQSEHGDNGPSEFDLDSIVSGFDISMLGLTEASCSVCFGTGYVGGYQAFNTYRKVITPEMTESDGHIDYQKKPFSGKCSSFKFQAVIPKGALQVDSFLLWNNNQIVPFTCTIDQVQASYHLLMSKADGRPHDFEITVNGEFTHFELQFNLSQESVWFEFPRLTKGQDISLLDQTEPFQIILSPNVPYLQAEDIITDAVFGKHYIVQGTPIWNTRNRRTLGWETQVRVAQPQELYTLLPKRQRTAVKNRTTNPVHDNRRGQRI